MRVLLIGFGAFGLWFARTMCELGHEIIAIERDGDLVDRYADWASRVIVGDATDPALLERAGAREVDAAVIGTAEALSTTILATVSLRDLGVRQIYAKVRSENLFLKKQLKKKDDFKEIIGKSEEIQSVFNLVNKVADTDSTILVYGESGTGKELIAKAIHYRSSRANNPFVSINCGALPENLLESELFGHVKGSFTGAIRDKEGMFKVASSGTFFLDEVGETSLAIQVKLLRVLQEREIIPVGGTAPIKVDVRLVAATNADLEKAVKEERFRADLYYRLNVIPILIPPLRDRRDDIALLVDHFLRLASERSGKRRAMSREAMELLSNYDWPGNVRELENILERACILQDGDEIQVEDLPEKVRHHSHERRKVVMQETQMTLDELEKEYLISVLEETGWQKKKASSILGINASTLYRKIQRYGLSQEMLKDR